MKKSTRKVLLGAATVAAVIAVAGDAYAAKDNLTMTAKIIAAVAITATQNLNFGTLTYTAAGTLSVNKAGVRSVTGGVGLVGATAKQGQFKVKAGAGAKLDVFLPATAKLDNGTGKILVVDQFKISSAAASSAVPYKFTLGGTKTTQADINVGARLNITGVVANEPAGTYTGTAVLTASYQ